MSLLEPVDKNPLLNQIDLDIKFWHSLFGRAFQDKVLIN